MQKEPKLEYQRAQRAEKDFRDQIVIRYREVLDVPEGQVANKLSRLLGCSDGTARTRKKKPDTFQIGELRKLIQALQPDIGVVLRFLGYRNQDIRKFMREYGGKEDAA